MIFRARQDLDHNPLKPRDEDEEKDLKMLITAEAGKKVLEQGKGELLNRLEGENSSSNGRRHSTSGQGLSPRAGSEVADGSMAEMMYDEIQKGRAEEARRTGRRRRSEPSLLHGHLNDNHHTEESLGDEEVDDSDESGSDSGSDESYPGSSEDGRGLLTDVPLILGPSEIEVLPMLIMSGIVQTIPGPNKPWLLEWEFVPPPREPWEESSEGQTKMREWHTLRTNLLLSQTSGRNLLRELLIFVAAWDLREEELYFKFMLKITEAILKNGLMPYAYHAFRDRSKSKDIISPAQAVLIKLLTSIFRTRTSTFLAALRQAYSKESERTVMHPSYGPIPYTLYLARMKHCPSRADLQLMTFLFSEFRQHIIPQTCALIFLQGQVRRGRAGSEDFPLNLWDMERMYEGVYQVLEFFAAIVEEISTNGIPAAPAQGLLDGPAHPLSGYWLHHQAKALNEYNRGEKEEDRYPRPEAKVAEKEHMMGEWFSWKKVLAGWEMVSELVTLLRELEDGIPKVNAQQQQVEKAAPLPGQVTGQQRSFSADAVAGVSQAENGDMEPPPIAVERPFDLDPQPSGSSIQTPAHDNDNDFELEHPLAYPNDESTLNPAVPSGLPGEGISAEGLSSDPHDQDEPADFEWRNLKKLTVLVLSSLVWKNRQVQDQLREYGGLEVLLRCCREDENNPYIREHAIMCLRFAVEGNEKNRDAIKELAESKGLNLIDRKSEGRVPEEVLDDCVYETHMDGGGKVGLRRKDSSKAPELPAGQPSTGTPAFVPIPPNPATAAQPAATSAPVSKSWSGLDGSADGASGAGRVGKGSGVDPVKLADVETKLRDLMQAEKLLTEADAKAYAKASKSADTEMSTEKARKLTESVLRSLPREGEKLVTEGQKAEVLARLDRAFEGAEKALTK